MRAPYNPFARAWTSSEAGYGLIRDSTDEPGKEQRPGGGSGSGRAALDVDAFKNILLTGSATPSPPSSIAGATVPSAAPSTTFAKPHDSSSSNTDTSSIFDRHYGVPLESPRGSPDHYESASDSDDDDKSGLMGQGRSDDLAPPAPPKPKTRGPQTVSFADFDQSIPEGFQSPGPRTPPVHTHITGILRPSTPRSSSDLNKPLPPPPAAETHSATPPDVPEKSGTPSQQPTPIIIAEDATPKKAPPPPPTRRKVGDATRPRSSSNLSQEPSYPPNEDEATSKPAPPPPPSRKAHAMATVAGPNSESASERSSPSQSTIEVPKAVPPPPPKRHPSKTGPNPRHSQSPLPRPGDAFLAAVAPTQPNAPPAPPPRRAGSKRSSMDGAPDSIARRVSSEYARRTSGNSFDSDRSGLISSLQQVAEPGESNEHALATPMESQGDILADMSAFQAEIEALRLQSQHSR